MYITHTTQTQTELRSTNNAHPIPAASHSNSCSSETRMQQQTAARMFLEGSNRCWHATSAKARRAGTGGGAGCWGERLAEMASYSDQNAEGPSYLRKSHLLAAHCRCAPLLRVVVVVVVVVVVA